ncbi:beta-L-arabinofuranosidase domain-containing protein [Streptomyces olindensis]|uniref:beta-L-arabinofuranosidase domain-containing protein n=1 Tax=Streptomyces olindensis TaxID=358823 RepID=UPI0033D26C27
MDYYERALTNHILASRRDTPGTDSPEVTYFVGMGPGVRRAFGNTGTCCGGTGLEDHTKYQDSVYFRSTDGDALYVNLPLAATLRWPERGLVVEQTSDYPADGVRTLTFREGGGRLALKLRIPSWATAGVTVTVNGAPHRGPARPGTCLTLNRNWRPGDRVSTTYRLRVERALDDPSTQALFHGPLLLTAQSPEQGANAISPASRPPHFTTHGLTLAPFHIGDDTPYHAYFTRSEPVRTC